jgi:hypothetical protein
MTVHRFQRSTDLPVYITPPDYRGQQLRTQPVTALPPPRDRYRARRRVMALVVLGLGVVVWLVWLALITVTVYGWLHAPNHLPHHP